MARHRIAAIVALALVCFAGGCTDRETAVGDGEADKHSAHKKMAATYEPIAPVFQPPVTGKLGDRWSADARPDADVHIAPKHAIRKKWPNLESGLLSPDGKTAAVYDGKAIYLTDSRGGNARKVQIKLVDKVVSPHWSVSFCFRPDSQRVAILTTLVYGEPLGAYAERLYTADVARLQAVRIAAWDGRVQGRGPQTAEREIEGWSPDGMSVRIRGAVYDGEDMPSDAGQIGIEHMLVKDTAAQSRS